MRKQCVEGAEQIRAGLPTIVISAKDASGQDVLDVKVMSDGAVLTTSLDARAIQLDPGAHAMRFERAGAAPVEKQIIAREGQKNQLVTVVFGEAKPTEPPPQPAPAGRATVRVKATCGTDPHAIASREGLVVVEVTDEKDVTLTPSSDPKPKLKYDEATHSRVMVNPEHVEFELPPGLHRLRVSSERCLPFATKVNVPEKGAMDFVANLTERLGAPARSDSGALVRFMRPTFAARNDKVQILAADGQPLCAEMPCAVRIPHDSGYSVAWLRSNGTRASVALSSPSEVALESSGEVTTRRRPSNAAWRTSSALGASAWAAGNRRNVLMFVLDSLL